MGGRLAALLAGDNILAERLVLSQDRLGGLCDGCSRGRTTNAPNIVMIGLELFVAICRLASLLVCRLQLFELVASNWIWRHLPEA